MSNSNHTYYLFLGNVLKQFSCVNFGYEINAYHSNHIKYFIDECFAGNVHSEMASKIHLF